MPLISSPEYTAVAHTGVGLNRPIDTFLKSVERRAFRIAELSLRDTDDALDVVQDAMMQVVSHYRDRAPDEWAPLFYQILRNKIRDMQRRRRTRNRWIAWWTSGVRTEDEAPDPIESALAETPSPDEQLVQAQAIARLEQGIHELSDRQREVFLLRVLEGLDVAQTAQVMGCSQGSVKTHYFRALARLREVLGDHQQ